MPKKLRKTRNRRPVERLVRRCQYCIYWEPIESHGDTPYMKTCHRYPPQVYSWGQTRMHEQPKTHPANWCGEFVWRFPNEKVRHGANTEDV